MSISILSTQIGVHAHPLGCAIGLVVTIKMSNFIAGHHGLTSVHRCMNTLLVIVQSFDIKQILLVAD